MQHFNVRQLTATVAASALFAACSGETINAPTAKPLSQSPSLAVTGGPNLGDARSMEGKLWVCKDGTTAAVSFDFAYSIKNQLTNVVVASGNVQVPMGTCVLAASITTVTSGKYRATVTEAAPPTDWVFNNITWNYPTAYTGPGLTSPIVDLPTRSVSNILMSNDLGVQVTFRNTYNPTAALGDRVWYDLNGDGVQDASETGIVGVKVELRDGSNAVIGTMTTGTDGIYGFTSLPAGSYTVCVDPTTLPAGYYQTYDLDGIATAHCAAASLTSGQVRTDVDFGYTANLGSLGDYVWYDANGNGVQESGEPGIAGVTVTLSGAASATTTTDANGAYLFSNLAAGSYTVTVATPAGYNVTPSNQGGDQALDSNGSPASATLATNTSSDLTIDFGFTKNVGQLGDFVWEDLNGNGLQDLNEPGIAGVTVTLSGAASGTTTTDANGYYLFTGLGAGSYTVTVASPSGYVATTSNVGSDRSIDSNGSPASATLAANNSIDLTIDFGFLKVKGPACTLTLGYWKNHGDKWDSRNDGKQFLTTTLFYNSGLTYLTLLNTPPVKGNAYVQLAHQFIAASLNVNGGPSGVAAVDAALAGAAAYFAAAPAGIPTPSGAQKTQLQAWATTLDNYNNGLLGVPHCD